MDTLPNNRAIKEYMQNLMKELDGENGNIMVCISPDNARIRHNPLEKETSSRRSQRTNIFSSSASLPPPPPRTQPSRWSNSSPAAAAVDAALAMADNTIGDSSCLNGGSSCMDPSRWERIEMPVRWSDESPTATIAKQKCVDNGSSTHVLTRTSPKQLLESSMGGNSLLVLSSSPYSCKDLVVPTFSSNHYDDRWTGKKTACIPPSPPCRRRSVLDVHHKNGETEETIHHETDTSPRSNDSHSGPRRRKKSGRITALPPKIRPDEEINNTSVHTKKIILSTEKYQFEKQRISSLIHRLPDSLRVPPY